MTHPQAKYHAIPPLEDQVYHSDIQEVRVDGHDFSSATGWLRIKTPTKWAYFLLGCAILLPWNVLMNAIPFFLSRLVGSPFYTTFASSFSSVYMLAKLISQLYCTFTSKQSSPSCRIFASLIGMTLIVTSLCLSTFVRGTPWTFFLLAMFSTAFLAVMAGYMCTAVYALASLLGASFLQIVISGHGAIAVVISAVQVASSIISLWSSSPNPVLVEAIVIEGEDNRAEELAIRISFGVCALFLFATLVAYTWLAAQPFYKSFTGVLEQQGEVATGELTGLVADVRRSPPTMAQSYVYHVLKRNMSFMFSIAYVFLVTLIAFPAITVLVLPVNSGIHPMLFTAVHFLVFNTGDLVGRYTCSFPHLVVWSANKILGMSLSRTLFIPLILLCNVHRPAIISPVPPIISSDILFMIIVLAMGYTNGYVVTMALLAVSSTDHNPGLEGRREDIDIAATLGGSFMIIGLTVGALCSFAV